MAPIFYNLVVCKKKLTKTSNTLINNTNTPEAGGEDRLVANGALNLRFINDTLSSESRDTKSECKH